ncbi:MAG: hypothetical protein ACXADH_00505 [Candidatus Kariarchaeaceae archaeon]|jgi:hypothetical protein
MATRDDLNVDYQPSPRVIEVAAPSTELTIQDLVDTLRLSEEAFAEGLAFDKLIDAAGKEDLGGGVLVGITANLQDAQVAFEARRTPAETGTVTTGSGAAINGLQTFVDTAADFLTAGIARGSLVINFTDNSIADVYEVIDANTLTTRALVNGTDNDYDIGDSYQVFNIIQCNISGGNLVAEDENDVQISSVVPTAFTQIVRTASSSATLSESQDIQYASFNGGVTVNTTSGTAGTTFPTGTSRQPVSNFTDALAIANDRGLTKFFVEGNCTLTGLTFDNFVFEGQSTSRTLITIDPSASVVASEFTNCTVTGTLDGNSVIENGVASNLNFIDGVVRSSGLVGEIVLSGSSTLQLLDCYEGSQVRPYINFGGGGTGLIVTNYNGSIGLKNKTGADSGFLDMASGDIEIDNDVTTGTITLRGVAKWNNKFDYSGGATIVDETIFTRVDETHGQVIRSVFLNGAAVSNGNGYQGTPFNNFPDAIGALDDRNLTHIEILGNVTLDRNIDGYTITGENLPIFDMNNFSVGATNFIKMVLTGTQNGGYPFLETCGMLDAIGINGQANVIALGGTIRVADNCNVLFNNVTPIQADSDIIIDFQDAFTIAKVDLENAHGDFVIRNMTAASDIFEINFLSGKITIENSCTAGTIIMNGTADWLNPEFSGGATIENRLINPEGAQFSEFVDGTVYIDVNEPTSGTFFPHGTVRLPCNNDIDAKVVYQANNIRKVKIESHTTLTTDHDDIKFFGRSPRTTTLTVGSGVSTNNCEFQNMLLTGTLTGNTYITQVALKNVTGLIGHFEQCVIREGTNTLGGAGIGMGMFNKCVAVSAPNPGTDIPIIDCAGSGQGVAFRQFVGEVKIINKTGPEPMSLALNGARVELDATVTGGNIRVFGVGELIDNSGGTAVVDRDELVSPEYVMEDVWSALASAFDDAGTMGTVMNDLWSMAAGRIVESPSGTFTFYDRDNTTVRFVLTKSGNQRTRS